MFLFTVGYEELDPSLNGAVSVSGGGCDQTDMLSINYLNFRPFLQKPYNCFDPCLASIFVSNDTVNSQKNLMFGCNIGKLYD